MKSLRPELLFDLALLVFAGAYCMIAWGYPAGGRLVPLTIGLAAVGLGLVHLSGNFIAMLRPFTHGATSEESGSEIPSSEIVAAGWAAGLLAGIFVVGALAAVFLFFLLYFGVRAKRWLLGAISAIVMTAVTWALFGQLMSLELPQGVLTEFVLRLF